MLRGIYRLCGEYGGRAVSTGTGVDEETTLVEMTWVEAWIQAIAGWLGLLTELFYAAHFIALCVILAITSSPPPPPPHETTANRCYTVLVRVAAFVMVHHIIALVRCAVRYKKSPAQQHQEQNQQQRETRASSHHYDDDVQKCFVTIRVVTFILCGAAIWVAISQGCIATPLALCVLAHLLAMLASLFIFTILALLQQFCITHPDNTPINPTLYQAC